jgi:hypothetical protein
MSQLNITPQGLSPARPALTPHSSDTSIDTIALPTTDTIVEAERLYKLLPAIHRIRDELQGGQLRALLTLIEQELLTIEGNIGDLYENWFIETCQAWVVPYIGDLLAVRNLNAVSPRTYGQERRAYVANTLAYRQRKGTTPVLEQLARDLTGWGARAVESLPLLATTQNLNHIRQNTTVDLRPEGRPERLGTPFEQRAAYTTEIRRSAGDSFGSLQGDRGRFNPSSISLYLWRLQSYPIEQGTARAIPAPDARLTQSATPEEPFRAWQSQSQGRYFTFNPLGLDAPLFNQPQTETEIITLAEEINVPGLLDPDILRAELQARQRGTISKLDGYFGRFPVLQIRGTIANTAFSIAPEEMQIEDLHWENNPNWKAPESTQNNGIESKVAIDPRLGRFAFLTDDLPDHVEVSYSYGFSGDVGGGAYDRTKLAADDRSALVWKVHPSEEASLSQAVRQWNQTAQKWQNCYDRIYIPVGQIELDADAEPIPDPSSSASKWHSKMQPGILEGLTVIATVGDIEATILPGKAIDRDGQLIHLTIRSHLILGDYPNQTVWLAIAYLPYRIDPRWELKIIPQSEAQQHPSDWLCQAPQDRDIRLARIELDASGRVQRIDHTVQLFVPGIIGDGMTIAVGSSDQQPIVSVSPGIAVNAKGRIIRLNQTLSVPLKQLLGQTTLTLQNRNIILFLTPTAQPKFGAVFDAELGIIRIHNNQTYEQDVALQIPATKRLQIIAANGDRPHLQGTLKLRGMAKPNSDDLGECLLEGLLIEGYLVVLPGQLKQLHLTHCTIVPQVGGLFVAKNSLPIEDENQEDAALSEMLQQGFKLFRRLLKIGLGRDRLSTQQRITRISQITKQQITNLFKAVQHLIQEWRNPAPLDFDESENQGSDESEPTLEDCLEETDEKKLPCVGLESEFSLEADNSQLTIVIERSICGAITLADTVPHLNILDSIVDGSVSCGAIAINAPGTIADLQSVTLFGTTLLRAMEAQNSLFRDKVMVLRRQVGCLRFCYVPEGSYTPRRYRCQPDLILSTQIEILPKPITTIVIDPTTDRMFAGTAGSGVFYYNSSDTVKAWIPLKGGLEDAYVTALFNEPTQGIIAGTMNGTLFQTTVPDIRPGQITSRGKKVKGVEIGLLQQLNVGDTITVHQQTRTVVQIVLASSVLYIDTPFDRDLTDQTEAIFSITKNRWSEIATTLSIVQIGTGTITSDGHEIRGRNTQFEQEIKVGDTIIAEEQTRHVGAVGSDTQCSLDLPFEPTISAAPFKIIRTFPNTPLTNTAITTLVPYETMLFAGTAGSGIFRSLNGGSHWTAMSSGLTNLDVRAIAIDSTNHTIYVGTNGGGVFRSIDYGDNWTGGDPPDPEIRQTGLTNARITSLSVNPRNGHLFAGTMNGVFRSTNNGDRWEPASEGLTSFNITALISNPRSGSGTLTTNYTQITFSDSEAFSKLDDFIIIVQDQTRIVTVERQDSNVIYTLNDAFDSDFTEPTPFTLIDIFAGTIDGKVFRSINEGQTWETIGSELTNADITTFTCSDDRAALLVGTRIGSIFRYGQQRWTSLNAGLNQVDETLLLLNQMQPSFTSEDYGQPSYAQLSLTCPIEIRTGAEDGSEIGAFSFLKQPQREANFQASLTEYLRFGLQADIIYVT